MAIRVRYFASLQDRMGRAEDAVEGAARLTAAEVWRAASHGQPWPERLLCAVNLEYAQPDTLVADGDEVAFFPPVTGG